jgi:putative ABC transport system permease protein
VAGFSSIIGGWAVNVSIALTALRTNLMRSILTTLGVMIGVLAVVLAVAVGSGAKVSVMESINTLGSNMALVFPQPDSEGGRRTETRGRLTERDARALEKQLTGIVGTAPQLRATVQLVAQGRNASTSALGITPGYGIVSNINAETGRFISDADVSSGARVIVLGPTVATTLFGEFDAVGQSVRVNRIPFIVIGVLESKGSSFGSDNDDVALIPISTVRQRLATGNNLQGPDDLHVLFVGFEDGVSLPAAKNEMTQILRSRYRVPDGRRIYGGKQQGYWNFSRCTCCDCFDFALGRRHWDYEYHVGECDRADPRNWPEDGARRAAA